LTTVIKLHPDHPLWPELLEHLQRTGDLRHVSNQQRVRPDLYFLGAMAAGKIVGHISLHKRVLQVPSQPPTPLCSDGQPQSELFVHTFSVEEFHRRQGLGAALQSAALGLGEELGCVQLRSWSSLDKVANYALKLKLGFLFCPGEHIAPSTGERVPGGWFVKGV
jgi:GNAT superfamily N-acetyltransferase